MRFKDILHIISKIILNLFCYFIILSISVFFGPIPFAIILFGYPIVIYIYYCKITITKSIKSKNSNTTKVIEIDEILKDPIENKTKLKNFNNIICLIKEKCFKYVETNKYIRNSKEKTLFRKLDVRYIRGLEIEKNSICNIGYTNKKIIIKRIQYGKNGFEVVQKIELNNEKVIKIYKDEIIEKEISSGDAFTGALAGGMLLGGFGAQIGALSNVGSKTKKVSYPTIVIEYIKENKEKKEKSKLVFYSENFKYDKIEKFIEKYYKKILKKERDKLEDIKL